MISGLVLLSVIVFSSSTHAYDDFLNVTYHTCYDGDTCKFTIAGLPEVFGDHMTIRLEGIDTPEIKGHCDQEKQLARQARDFIRQQLTKAQVIHLKRTERGKYFRLLAIVEADGVNINQLMRNQGLAVEYHGGKKTIDWCSPEATNLRTAP